MQISKTYQAIAVVLTTVLSSSLLGQTFQQTSSGTNYPWSASESSSSSVKTSPVVGTTSSEYYQPAKQDVPEPPKIGLENAVQAPAKQEVEAVPEATNYQFDQVPSAPSDGDVYNSVVQPGLSVQSNANDPEPNYCFRPQKQWCNLGCQQRLFNRPIAGVNVGGFAQFGYHARNILPFNNRRDRFNLHQTWLHFDTAGSSNSPLRFRLDTVYGLDAQEFQAVGNRTTGAPDGWDNDFDNGSFGWAIPQAFVEFGLADWQVKVGKFLSPIGYEAAPSTENFFYSRTYARRFIEPFSHTGVLAEQNNGAMTRLVGLTAGWDSAFESNESGFNLLTGMRFEPNEYTRFTTTSSLGDTGYRGSGTLTSVVAEVQLTSKVSYVGQVDYLNLNLNQTDEFSVINSLYYCHNRCLSVGSRLEWFKSDQLQAETASTYDYTIGANYRPHSNILIRPEVRWDWGENALDNGDVNFGFDTIFTF